jgi:hypothetical protein
MVNKIIKVLAIAGVIFMTPVFVYSKVITLDAVSEFSTSNPPQSVEVRLPKETKFYDITLSKDTVIKCNLTDITPPKRLKRGASFTLIPVSYADEKQEHVEFKTPQKARYIKKLEPAAAAKAVASTAVKTVGGKIVPGLGIGISAIEGAVKGEEGNKIKSAAQNVYQSSPLSYVEIGQELQVNPNDRLIVRLTKNKTKASKNNNSTDTHNLSKPLPPLEF